MSIVWVLLNRVQNGGIFTYFRISST